MSVDRTRWTREIGVLVVQNAIQKVGSTVNLKGALEIFHEGSKGRDIDLTVFPEAFATGFDQDAGYASADGYQSILDTMSAEAAEYGSDLIFTLLVREGSDLFNRAFWIDGKGAIKGTYDKTHLFSRSDEDKHFTRGSSLKVFMVRDVPVGIVTCYEIRFPEISMALAREGAAVLAFVAQWPESRVHQWDSFLVARAVENQVYSIGANVCGVHGKVSMGGHSAIIEPYGGTMTSLGGEAGSCFAVLGPERMERFRKGIPMSRDRRAVADVVTQR